MTFIEQKILVGVAMVLAYTVYQFCVATPEVE
jgi:hypothetical protein